MKALKHVLASTGTAVLLALTGCAGEPTIQTGEDAETIMGTLNRVDNSRVALAYVDPQVDYSRFTRVQILPLDLDHVEIVQPNMSSSMVNRHNREWQLTDDDRTRLQDTFREVTAGVIADRGVFELSDTGGEDVLTIGAMMTRIAPTAPRDDASSRGTARSRVYSQGAGSISIAIVLADGYSGEVVALIKDTRSGNNSVWGVNNSVSNMAEVRRAFSTWATQIHDGLVALKARSAG